MVDPTHYMTSDVFCNKALRHVSENLVRLQKDLWHNVSLTDGYINAISHTYEGAEETLKMLKDLQDFMSLEASRIEKNTKKFIVNECHQINPFPDPEDLEEREDCEWEWIDPCDQSSDEDDF